MSAREEILARLRKQGQERAAPQAWRSQRQFADLTEQFCKALTAANGEAYEVSSLAEGLTRIGIILDALEARRVVVNSEPPLNEIDLPGRWQGIEWHIVGRSEGDLREFCADADVGLSSADAALAETGSLIVNSGPGKSRLATLLPPVHLALVPASRLTADIFTWTAARQGSLPANSVIISGPSKTADIEQTLAVGVHGPKRFIVVLYQDDEDEDSS